MAITVRELLVVLGFENDEAGAKKAEGLLKGVGKTAAALVTGLAAAGTALVALTLKASQAGDAAAKAAQKFGITAQEAQELKFIAEANSLSFEQMGGGLRFLQRSAVEAARGGKSARDAYAQLGVNVRGANGQIKPAVQLFRDVADRISKIDDPAKRTALALKIFGRGGNELLPVLLEGGKAIAEMQRRARDLGGVLDEEAVKGAVALDDAVDDLTFGVGGLSKRIGASLFPVITRITKAMTEWLIANRKTIDDGIKRFARAVTGLVDAIGTTVAYLSRHKTFVLAFIATALTPLILAFGKLALAQLVAFAPTAILAAGFLALAAVIALVIEDIYMFVTGGKSALGQLRDAFNKRAEDPNAHWIVVTIGFILDSLSRAILAVDDFFRGFFEEAEQLGGITNALGSMWDTAIGFWKRQLIDFFMWLRDQIAETALNTATFGLSGFAKQAGSALNIGEKAKAIGNRVTNFIGEATTAQLNRPLIAPGTSGANTTVNLGGQSINVTVSGGGNVSPRDVGEATESGVSRALDKAHNEIRSRFRERP